MKSKSFILIAVLFVILLIVVFVKNNMENSRNRQRIFVYDNKNNEILTISDKKQSDYFASIMQKGIEKSANKNKEELAAGLPEDAELMYTYKFEKGQFQLVGGEMRVYKNYPLIHLKAGPIEVVLKIDESEWEKFKDPESNFK